MSKDDMVKLNINKFISNSKKSDDKLYNPEIIEDNETDEKQPKKRGRKKGSKNNTEIVTATKERPLSTPVPTTSMSYLQENIPYATAYQETNQQLDDSINQLNVLGSEIFSELQNVRASKTLKNKYVYINDMTSTAANIINAKISAIREKNKSINDVNHLELSRLKELKSKEANEDDNTRIANLYDAFIHTPIGAGPVNLAPSMPDLITVNGTNLPHSSIGGDNQAIWEQNLNPAENYMVLEAKGIAQTVVVYDKESGNRWFDVIDKNTKQSIPNVEKPDNSRVYDLDINLRGGFARDSNQNIVYPLIVLNDNINEY